MKSEILIIILFSLGLAWIMWKWIEGSQRHLSEQNIEDFLTNRMNQTQLKHAREHLLQCRECKELLDQIAKNPQKHKPSRLLKRKFDEQ